MKQNNDDSAKVSVPKGILQTNNKTTSKNRRISWGENKIKEYEKNEDFHLNTIEEYNSFSSGLQENKSEKDKDKVKEEEEKDDKTQIEYI